MEMMEIVSFSFLALPLKCGVHCQVWQRCRISPQQGCEEQVPLEDPGPPRAASTPSQEFPRCCAALELALVSPGGNSQLEFPQQHPALSWLELTQPHFPGWAGLTSPGIGIGTARGFHGTQCQHWGHGAVSLPLTQACPSSVSWGHPSWPGNALLAPRTQQ